MTQPRKIYLVGHTYDDFSGIGFHPQVACLTPEKAQEEADRLVSANPRLKGTFRFADLDYTADEFCEWNYLGKVGIMDVEVTE